jgi:CRISPR-associated protein Cmr4
MKSHRLFLYALDPTHVGAGGYRLGRVDNTIVRDAATQLPKIPGTSLNGALRAAAIYSLEDAAEREQAQKYARHTLDRGNEKREDHKRGAEDPVASIFGYAEGDNESGGTSRIGMLSVRDAEILAYPVPTMMGPRWVTTPFLLARAGCTVGKDLHPASEETVFVQNLPGSAERLNLGWLLLSAQKKDIPFSDFTGQPALEFIKTNLVLVHDNLFPALVNSNLETRTSVSIDFESGAGADGLLFTYEATPRGTLFLGQLDFDDLRFPGLYGKAFARVEKALALASALGYGGMTTRGFGRMSAILQEAA